MDLRDYKLHFQDSIEKNRHSYKILAFHGGSFSIMLSWVQQ